MIRLPIFIIYWAVFLAIKIPTIILGFVMVPILWGQRNTLYADLPWWTRPWSNPEDWMGGPLGFQNSLPAWWVTTRGAEFKDFFQYHAVRNPANGLRSFEFLYLDIVTKKVKYKTNSVMKHYEPHLIRSDTKNPRKTGWYIAWQGYQAGVKYIRLWNEEYTKSIKKIDNVGPIWKLFTFWKWKIVESEKTFVARHLVFKFGWRIQPSDAFTQPSDIRGKDSGFATKLLIFRKDYQ